MRENKNFEAFGKPFPASDVSWKLQCTTKDKSRGMAVPYLDARAISDRLDEVVGQYAWKDSYLQWHNYSKNIRENNQTSEKQINSQLCTIYIYDEELKEWIGINFNIKSATWVCGQKVGPKLKLRRLYVYLRRANTSY